MEFWQGKMLGASPAIIKIQEALGEDADLHLVGGCVRDLILNKTPKDYDFATVLAPEIVQRRCEAAGIQTVIVGIRRGTISAIIDHEAFEITTFRKKGKETLFSKTIEEDLSARDFTINAIAYNLQRAELVDPFYGGIDLETGRLVAVGNAAERFEEDPHRIIRMCRFSAQFDFDIHAKDMECAQSLKSLLKTIEAERINAELKKIFNDLSGTSLLKCLMLLNDVGFFEMWIPEITACRGVTQNKYHMFDVYEHIIKVVAGCKSYHVKLAALFHDIGKPETRTEGLVEDVHFYRHEDVGAVMAEEIMRRLKFSTNDIQIVTQLVRFHMRPIDCGKKAIRKLKAALGSNFSNWMELKYADKFFGGTPEEELVRYTKDWNTFITLLAEVENEELVHPTTKLAINGEVVMKLFDLKPGPEVGKWLAKLQDYVFEFPAMNTEEHLTGFLIATECVENEERRNNV